MESHLSGLFELHHDILVRQIHKILWRSDAHIVTA